MEYVVYPIVAILIAMTIVGLSFAVLIVKKIWIEILDRKPR